MLNKGTEMDTSNPYGAPQAQVSDGLEPLHTEPASRWRRFFNLLIDYSCLVLLAVVASIVFVLIGGETAMIEMEQANPLRDYAFGIGAMLAYYLPMEGLFGLTIGKLVTGTRVVNEHGTPPSWGQVLGRTLCRFIPFEALSMFSSSRRGWHDLVPNTYVVLKRRPISSTG